MIFRIDLAQQIYIGKIYILFIAMIAEKRLGRGGLLWWVKWSRTNVWLLPWSLWTRWKRLKYYETLFLNPQLDSNELA